MKINVLLKKTFGYLQRIGKALILPIALLPAAGLLVGIGTLFENQVLAYHIPILENGFIILIKNICLAAGNIVFSNLPLLFAVGISIGMNSGNGVSALAAIMGFLTMNTTIGVILGITPDMVENSFMYTNILGIATLPTGVFGGIIIGILASILYEKFHSIKLPSYLGFFSGKRFVPIISSIAGIIVGILMSLIWPSIQIILINFSKEIINTNESIAAFIFGFTERALIPFGIHHIWYAPFWYQFGEYINASGNLVVGDQSIFFAQLKDNVAFTAGTFMTGKYPFMMFGIPATALAMYHESKNNKKKLISGILLTGALTSFLTGITEPIEFLFLFTSPLLFGIHCILAGLSFMIMQILNVKIGLTFSGGFIDYLLFGVLPNRTRWWLVIVVGLIFAIIYYIIFRYFIRKFNLEIPGRENDDVTKETDITNGFVAYEVLKALGGSRNIKFIDSCITRLRITVNNIEKVDKDKLKSLGAIDLMIIGDNIQAIFGTQSDLLKEQINDVMEGKEIINKKEKKIEKIKKGIDTKIEIAIPITGELLRLEEVPDDIFSMKLIGDGFAIKPKDNILRAPIRGMITNISKDKHAITVTTKEGYEIFIHIGIDSLKLKGKGFNVLVEVGEIVDQNQDLIEFSLTELSNSAKSIITPIIFKNLNKNQYVYFKDKLNVKCGEKGKVFIHEDNKE